ncbi:LysM peptidoglycan-binding domain-containing protein [Rhodobium gokarnense]|uniref:Nucleoid-associated protein YgaU n=1 Tax=Rhodobium gokarnense TaxID=364296 RepID=A0ABT3HGD0_9HYPH|nr:LysM peptidoglycan-binding domain-containing protein [Rhodobium gokarnense]MCW2309448.1 nucleoid-associated protein YgaU [Rhodobium gokarnense]
MSKIALIWSAIAVGGTAATVGALVATGVIDIDRLTGSPQTTPAPLTSDAGTATPGSGKTAEAPQKAAPADTGAAKGTITEARAPEPDAKTAETPAASPPKKKPSFDIVRVEPTGDAVVAGQSEPGAIVAVLSNGTVVGKTVADPTGAWSMVLEKPLEPGDHDLSASSKKSEDDPEETESDDRIAVSIPEDDAEELLVVMSKPGEPARVLQKPKAKPGTEVAAAEPAAPAEPAGQEAASAEPTTGEAAPSGAAEQPSAPQIALAEPADTPEAPASVAGASAKTVTVEAVETERGRLFVAGAAEPDADVRVYVEDEFVGTAKANADGRWLLEAPKDLATGQHRVRADQVADEAGTVVARAEVPFQKDENAVVLTPLEIASGGTEGDAGSITIAKVPSVIIRKGDNLWRISRRRYGEGVRYTTIYAANKEQIRNPDLIYPGQVFMVPEGDVGWSTN